MIRGSKVRTTKRLVNMQGRWFNKGLQGTILSTIGADSLQPKRFFVGIGDSDLCSSNIIAFEHELEVITDV